MLDFGATGSHSNAIEFADTDYGVLDGLTQYTMLIPIRPLVNGWSTDAIFSKFLGANGWTLRAQTDTGNNRVRMIHRSSSSSDNPGNNTTNLPTGSTYRLILWWNGTTFRYYINGTSEGDVAFTKAIGDSSAVVSIGNEDTLSEGAQVATGPIVAWGNYALTAGEVAQADAGLTLPAASKAVFFYRGILIPGLEEIQRIEGTKQGTVNLLADAVDTFFPVSRTIENWRQLATQQLLERSGDELGFKLRVPLHLGEQLELMDPINVSHDALMLAASRLAGLQGLDPTQLFQDWRRGLYLYASRSLDWNAREVEMGFSELEQALATYFASERAPFGTADDYPGVARFDLGGILTQARTSKGYIEQENSQIVENGEGNFLAAVGPNVSKVSYLGLLSEEAVANDFANPVFASGLTSWTKQEVGGGTVTVVTDRLVFPSEVTGNSIEVVGAAASENLFRQDWAVLAADGFGRLMFIHSDRAAASNPNWKVQRDTDSWWWNDSTKAWQSSEVVNGTPTAWDSVNSLEIAAIFWSNPIPIDQNETWTVSIGTVGAKTHNFYCANVTPGKLRYSPLIDTTATDDDEFTDELDTTSDPEVRQLAYAGRGRMTVDVLALQDGGDLEDGDELALLVAQYGASEKDFYALLYQKLSGQNVRFSFERWRDVAGTSTLDVRATKDETIVRGTTYRVTARYTNDTTLDLGLAANTLRITVGEQNGVDAVAAGIFSVTEAITKLWFGCAPSGTGFRRAGNYIQLIRCEPRVIADEEVLAG